MKGLLKTNSIISIIKSMANFMYFHLANKDKNYESMAVLKNNLFD